MLVDWYYGFKGKIDMLWSHKSDESLSKKVYTDLTIIEEERIPLMKFNLNWKRFAISASITAFVYMIFV